MLLEAESFFRARGRVAQLEERHAYTVDVTGSSPVPPTMKHGGNATKEQASCIK